MKNFLRIPKKLEEKIVSSLRLIKRALEIETKENSIMLKTYLRYSQGLASEEEMLKANKQFQTLLKTLGLGALALLPFAPVTIPAMVQLAKKFDIDLIPQSFKDNSPE